MVRYAVLAAAAALLGLAALDLATLWMAGVYLPFSALWAWVALFWVGKASLSVVGAWGLWQRRWWGSAAAGVVFAVMVTLQSNGWLVVAGRSPYRSAVGWLGLGVVGVAWAVGRRTRDREPGSERTTPTPPAPSGSTAPEAR